MVKPLFLPTADGQPGVLVSAVELTKTIEQRFGGPNQHVPMAYDAIFVDLLGRTQSQQIAPENQKPKVPQKQEPGVEMDM